MRIHKETASRMTDTRKGMRHPQTLNASSPTKVRVPITTSNAANSPSVAVV